MGRRKWIQVFSLTLMFLICATVYVSLTGLPQKKSEAANEVKAYLIHTRAYSTEDIQEIRGVYSFKSGDYQAEVRYKDEPNVNYVYEKKAGTFLLIETSNLHGKHMDETFY
ncbi:DUF3139 domain-containing protein [Paenibacillus sp. NPDC056722]|uniref:DUF3139 domain-containing protein n=1 Tax=Paenibacillus sp. NPDC056722 TaxID=3345924 RepID=UPI00367E74E1